MYRYIHISIFHEGMDSKSKSFDFILEYFSLMSVLDYLSVLDQ